MNVFKVQKCIIISLLLSFYISCEARASHATADSAFDLLIRKARVFDPRSGMNGRYDLAIRAGRIVKIAKKIPATDAKKTVTVKKLWAVPGFIDIHTHVFAGSEPGKFANGTSSVNPDQFCPMNGVTTVVDAGTSGWRNVDAFRRQIIDPSRTRVLAFLNIAGAGMSGKPWEEDTTDMGWQWVKQALAKHADKIVGFKVGHFTQPGVRPMLAAREMGDSAGLPVFVECHLPQIPLEAQLGFLRKGDIMTHCFEQVDERTPFVQSNGKIHQQVLAAQERGVLFDLGHGGAGFWFDQSQPGLRAGFSPYTFGTDLHKNSISASMKSLPNVISKFLAMGMTLEDAVTRCTWNAAKAIHRTELGHISEGSIADLALFRIERGRFGFTDAGGKRIIGKRKIQVELTIRDGRVIWDLQGRLAEAWQAP